MISGSKRINRSLRFSFINGIFASAMLGFVQEYLTPFLLLLGGGVRQVGMLSAFPNLFASLVQLKSADLVERLKSRKKVVAIFVFLQALMLLPMAALALSGRMRAEVFIVLVVFFASFVALATPAWGSLMSDLVPKGKWGEYFGWRNRTLGFVTVVSTFTAGYILHQTKKFNPFLGFALIFFAAFIFRMISWYFLRKTEEPPALYRRENYFTLLDFLARIKKSNFAKFVLFVALMNFSVNLASPFFAVLMLRELQFSYLLYTGITVTATLTVYFMFSRWGRHADRVGNLKIIKFTAPFIGLVPLLWIINRQPAFLFFAQILSGFVWAGFNLCSANFIYDAVIPEKRTRCIAYFNVLTGFALFAGALSGGFLIQKLPPLFGHRILSLFLISAILRILTGLSLPARLKEVRPVEKIGQIQLFFSIIGMKPILGAERKTIRY